MKRPIPLVLVLAATAAIASGPAAADPRVLSISPRVADRGELVTITGSGFGARKLRVTLDGRPVELVSATGNRARFRVPTLGPVGDVDVVVRNPGGREARIGLTVRFDGATEAVVDEEKGVSAAVGADGGTIEVAGMSLTVPADAVPEGTTITATPLTGLTGSPFAAAPVGLKLEPSGLVLMQPATLTLPKPAGSGLSVGFGFDGDGNDFHLVPHRVVGGSVQIKVWHFSGAGVLPARLSELQTALRYEPSPAHMRAEQRIAEALVDAELNGTDPGPKIAAALHEWRLRSVQTGLDVARETTEIAFFELAFGEWLAWIAYLQEYRDSIGADDASGLDAASRFDRDLATVSAAVVARRALDDCTGPTLPLSALRKVIRVAAPVNIAELPIDDASDPGERPLPDGRNLPTGCLDVQLGAIDHAPAFARNRENSFVAVAQVVFWNGPPSTAIPLRYRLGDSTDGPPAPLASQTTTGGFSTTISPTALGLRTFELTVDLGADDVLRAFFDRRSLTVPVRERLELHARRAGDAAFADTVGAVAPGDSVILRIRLAGDDRSGKEIILTHDGAGALAAATTTDASGEAIVTYTAPAASAVELVTASITEDGLTSGDATVITTETPVAIAISPASTTLAPGGTRQFTATVTGTANASVTWTATGGAISETGLYTAGTTPGTFAVVATSVADPAKSAAATVTVAVSGPADVVPIAGPTHFRRVLALAGTDGIAVQQLSGGAPFWTRSVSVTRPEGTATARLTTTEASVDGKLQSLTLNGGATVSSGPVSPTNTAASEYFLNFEVGPEGVRYAFDASVSLTGGPRAFVVLGLQNVETGEFVFGSFGEHPREQANLRAAGALAPGLYSFVLRGAINPGRSGDPEAAALSFEGALRFTPPAGAG